MGVKRDETLVVRQARQRDLAAAQLAIIMEFSVRRSLQGKARRRGNASRLEAIGTEAIGEACAKVAARGVVELNFLAPASGFLKAGERFLTAGTEFFDGSHGFGKVGYGLGGAARKGEGRGSPAVAAGAGFILWGGRVRRCWQRAVSLGKVLYYDVRTIS
jgi:hypothetical protein